MKLKEQLKLLQGQDVRVGAVSAFVYCGICDDNIFDFMEKTSKEYYRELIFNEKKANEHLANFETFWINKTNNEVKKIKTRCEENEELDLDTELTNMMEKFTKDKVEDKKNTIKKIKTLKRRINEFTPFLTRKVKEVYESIYEEGTKIVVFEGEETGAFWNKREFIKANGKRRTV